MKSGYEEGAMAKESATIDTTIDDASDKLSVYSPYEEEPLRAGADKVGTGNVPGPALYKNRSNVSELSRIISGIRDDFHQDQASAENYKETGLPGKIIGDQLDNISRRNSRVDEESTHGSKIEDNEETDNLPPLDKGYAWATAFIAFAAVFATWGSNASFGVFLDYYISNNVFEGATMYDFALIGGIVVFLAQGLCPFATVFYKVFGIKTTTIVGIILQTAGYLLASFSTKLWQLYLSQGVIVGLSFSLVYVPATLILPQWFDKYRAFAFGIAVGGSGIGGLTFSLSVNKVFQDTGSQHWGLRLAALIALLVALPCLFLKPRVDNVLPFSQRFTKKFIRDNFRLIFDLKVFKSPALIILSLWYGFALLGYITVLFSVAPYASAIGLSSKQGSVVTALLNAGQTIGRPAWGLLSDRIGRSNTAFMCSMINTVLLLAFWINVNSFGSLSAFSILIGCVIGMGSTLSSPLCTEVIRGPHELPAAWSGLNIIVSVFCLVAEVIALALKKGTGPKQYLHSQIFAGACFFFAGLLALGVREYLVSKKLKYRHSCSLRALEELNSPKRYLKAEDLQKNEEVQQEASLLKERINRHETLLNKGLTYYFIRMFYPLIV